MLPEIGGLELLVIAAVALIVVGPKDLPVMLRKLGQFTAKIRSMANEFRASFDEMARQSELDELRKEVEAMRRGQLIENAADASKAQVDQVFKEIGDSLDSSGVQFYPPMSHQYDAPAEPAAVEPPLEPVVEEAKPRARKPKAEAAAKPKAAASKSKAPAKPKTKAGAKA